MNTVCISELCNKNCGMGRAHGICRGSKKFVYFLLGENVMGRDHLGSIGIGRRIALKWIIEKQVVNF
jgi:hypothetical protein